MVLEVTIHNNIYYLLYIFNDRGIHDNSQPAKWLLSCNGTKGRAIEKNVPEQSIYFSQFRNNFFQKHDFTMSETFFFGSYQRWKKFFSAYYSKPTCTGQAAPNVVTSLDNSTTIRACSYYSCSAIVRTARPHSKVFLGSLDGQ